MKRADGDIDELIEFWTLLDEDREMLVGKRGANALGFALLLKHYSQLGRFPRGRSDLSETVVEFVARQVGVDASVLGFYEWSGRTIEYHRNQVRAHLGFRVATISDQEKLTVWLASNVAHAERRPERVRDELLAQFRAERIEPPTAGRVAGGRPVSVLVGAVEQPGVVAAVSCVAAAEQSHAVSPTMSSAASTAQRPVRAHRPSASAGAFLPAVARQQTPLRGGLLTVLVG